MGWPNSAVAYRARSLTDKFPPPTDIVANGVEDPIYQMYFGKGSYVTVLGAYEGILRSNKMVRRCTVCAVP